MDFSSVHVPYVLASYALAAVVFFLLFYWTIRQDRKIQHALEKLVSDAA
jgi:preprotein translocase subunit YajC